MTPNFDLKSSKEKKIDTNKIKLEFPWPELINKGMTHLYGIKNQINELEIPIEQDILLEYVYLYTSKFQLKDHKEIQLSILKENRFFIYHNWEFMRKSYAKLNDAVSGVNIYDTIFGFPYGIVSWIDEFSNHEVPDGSIDYRQNIALFTTTDNDVKIVIELHYEK